jgi:hypothetical protein
MAFQSNAQRKEKRRDFMKEQSPLPEQELFSDVQIARIFGVSLAWVRKNRMKRTGFPFVKLGTLVRYRRRDVEDYLNRCPKGGEHDRAA